MNLEDISLSEDFRRDLAFLGVSLLIVVIAVGAHNYATPDDPLRVGMVELETRCAGIDAGVCIGLERRHHKTFNYDDYEEVEEGTPNFYRKVEAELMARAQNTCDRNTTGMEWMSEVSYRNRTAENWLENENIDLLPCKHTTYRTMDWGEN